MYYSIPFTFNSHSSFYQYLHSPFSFYTISSHFLSIPYHSVFYQHQTPNSYVYLSCNSIVHPPLPDSAPILEYRFISQTLQPGPSVSLKCIASGAPTPHVSWTLDGFPLPQHDRSVRQGWHAFLRDRVYGEGASGLFMGIGYYSRCF